jgi:hypothetical protein
MGGRWNSEFIRAVTGECVIYKFPVRLAGQMAVLVEVAVKASHIRMLKPRVQLISQSDQDSADGFLVHVLNSHEGQRDIETSEVEKCASDQASFSFVVEGLG